MNEVERLERRLEDMDRRIRQVEGGQRSGLSDIALASGTGAYTITAFGVNNWQDDPGFRTPEVALHTGSRVLVLATWLAVNVGEAGALPATDFRSSAVVMGVQIDSTEPQTFTAPPMMWESVVDGTEPGAFVRFTQSVVAFRQDLAPGEHTFTMRFYAIDSDPTGTVNPRIFDTTLAVIPLGYS